MGSIIIGIIFIIAGLGSLPKGSTAGGIVCLLIGAGLIWFGIKKLRYKGTIPEKETKEADSLPDALGTYTFEPTGTLHECIYDERFEQREDAIEASKKGDPIEVREFEWKGVPALAFYNSRIHADVGVASTKDDLKSIIYLKDHYELRAKIEGFTSFEFHGEKHKNCRIKISYYDKDAINEAVQVQ